MSRGWRSAHPAETLAALNSVGSGRNLALDADFAQAAGQLIKQTRIAGDSLGAAVEVVAVNVPPLVGDPLYQSLKLRLMGASAVSTPCKG